MVIVPVVTYCFLVNTWSCPSRENKLDRLVKKAQDIVLETEDPSKVNIMHVNKKSSYEKALLSNI